MKKNLILFLLFTLFTTASCFEFLFEKLLYQYDYANKQPVSEIAPENLEKMDLKLNDGTRIVGWYQKNAPTNWPILVYFHGNGLNIQGLYAGKGFENFFDLETQGLAFDYQKYGLSTGIPNEQNIMEASRAVMEFVKTKFPNRPVVVWGRSLGCAPATQIAEQYQGLVKGLILTSPWNSAWKLVQKVTNFSESASKRDVKGNAWKTEEYAQRIRIPTLIHHGVLDQTVAFSLGEELAKSFPSGVAKFIAVEGKDHSDVLSTVQMQQIYEFIKSL